MKDILSIGLMFSAQIEASSKALKDKAIKEYEDALKMPRKKKKQAKKSAILLYSIACSTSEYIFN